jgi:glycosyltransferase involved in cell wall biosynthesis
MKEELERSYPAAAGRLEVIAAPPPLWLQHGEKRIVHREQSLSLFYPAAGYPHKNHQILAAMNRARPSANILEKIVVTLKPNDFHALQAVDWLANVGHLNAEACLQQYHMTDGLFFPSLLESSPMPLVEAMTLGLPIVCADLPYAHWICEDEAIYFDPENPADAWRAIAELKTRLAAGWSPDWTRAVQKFPSDWDKVATLFLEILRDA